MWSECDAGPRVRRSAQFEAGKKQTLSQHIQQDTHAGRPRTPYHLCRAYVEGSSSTKTKQHLLRDEAHSVCVCV